MKIICFNGRIILLKFNRKENDIGENYIHFKHIQGGEMLYNNMPNKRYKMISDYQKERSEDLKDENSGD